jgi:hypothetical protein
MRTKIFSVGATKRTQYAYLYEYIHVFQQHSPKTSANVGTRKSLNRYSS